MVVPVRTYLFLSLISHMQRHSQTQGWWRDHYETHPRKGTAGSDAWAPGKSQKYKMYCKECWIHHFAAIKNEQAQADLNGTVCMYPRGDQAISEYCSYGAFHVDKELEFYELLDLDAEGDDDIQVDTIDNTTEQVLGFEY